MFAGLLFQLKVVINGMFYRLPACNLLSLNINNQGEKRSAFEVSSNSYNFLFIYFFNTNYAPEQKGAECRILWRLQVESKMQLKIFKFGLGYWFSHQMSQVIATVMSGRNDRT